MCCPKGAWEWKLWYEWVIGAVPDARVSGRGAGAGGIRVADPDARGGGGRIDDAI